MPKDLIDPINGTEEEVIAKISTTLLPVNPNLGKKWKILKRGNLQDILEIPSSVDCYVLDRPDHLAIISQRGMQRILGLNDSGRAFPDLMSLKSIRETGGQDLVQRLSTPLAIQGLNGGQDFLGYAASSLIDVCNIIIEASKSGKLNRPTVLARAQTLIGACAKSGIDRLVYAAAGYDPTLEETIIAFKAYVQEEAKKYEKEFPRELYLEWARLYNITLPEKGWPWEFRHLTIKHIYIPLAQSNGKLLKLLREAKASVEKGNNKKLFQFLNEVGSRALRMHLGRVLEMAESSESSEEYDKKIKKRFDPQLELEFTFPKKPIDKQE